MGNFKIKPMFAAASPGKVKTQIYNTETGALEVSDQTEGTDAVAAVKGEAAVYDTGKSLKGLSTEQKDWRTKEIDKLGGLEAYHKKYGDSKTGKVVKEEIKEVVAKPKTKGKKTGAVVATTSKTNDQLDINSERTQIRKGELVTRKGYKTNVAQGKNAYDAAIHGDNKSAYMKNVKKQAKKIQLDKDNVNNNKNSSNHTDGIGTKDGGKYNVEENKDATNTSKEEHDDAQFNAAKGGATGGGVKETPTFTVKHESDSSGTKFGNFLRGKGFNKTNKEGKVVTTGTNNNDNLNQGGGKGKVGGKNETEELDKSM